MASDIDIYKTQNFGNRLGFGEKAALLIVDLVNGFTDPAKFGGGNIQEAIERHRGPPRLLPGARRAGRAHPRDLRRRRGGREHHVHEGALAHDPHRGCAGEPDRRRA